MSNPVRTKTLAVRIDGNHTDIVLSNYSDRLFIVLTQFKKIGTVLTVNRELITEGRDVGGEVYNIYPVLGKDDEDVHVAVRFLAEQLDVTKPVLFSISLKDYSPKVLKALTQVLLQNKVW